jgi:hypothetical protein
MSFLLGGYINISHLTDKRFDDNQTSINSIFEIEKKTRNSNSFLHNNNHETSEKQIPIYSQNAILYQSILKYSITFGTREYFDMDNIAEKHLLKTSSIYQNYYKDSNTRTNVSNRITKVKSDIKPLLENLIFLELLESKDSNKLDTDGEKVFLYKFTEYGRLIGLIIRSDENLIDPSIYNEIIKQFAAFRKTKKDSASLFFSILFSKINDWNFAKLFVEDLKMIIKDPDFDDQLKLLEKANNDIIRHAMSFSKFYNYFEESLNELEKIDRRRYEMFMHKFKRIFERFQEIKCYNNEIFERERMECRNQFSFVVVEGNCDFCDNLIYEKMRLIRFLQIVFRESQDKCPVCCQGYLDYS